MKYVQLRAFHRVALEGSFSKAAASLRVTQPTVSAQVKDLEDACGTRLLDRRRRVEPTEFGRRLLDLTRRLFDVEQEIDELLTGGRSLDSGHLRIGTDSPAHASPLLAGFARRYPGLSLSLATGNADEMLRALLDHRTDVAVVARRSDDPRVEALPFSEDPLVLFAHREHPLASRRSLALAAVAEQRLVVREQGSITRELFQGALESRGIRPAAMMEIDSREAVHEAVAAGLGLGVVARSEVAHDPRLRTIALRDARLLMSEYVLCLRDRSRLPIVRAFLDLAHELAGR